MKRTALKALISVLVFLIALEGALQIAHLVTSRRAPEDISADVPVILCLGDSHTYGAGVSEDKTYPAHLESMLQQKGIEAKVVNLGAPGTNTSQIRRELPGLLNSYTPEIVVVLAGVNNGWNRRDQAWSDIEEGLEVPVSTRARDWIFANVRTVRGADVILHRLKWAGPPEETSRDRSGNIVIHHRDEEKGLEPPERTYDRARRDLVAIIAACRAEHAQAVLMTYVSDPEYTFETPNQLLREVAARMNTPISDNDKVLRPVLMKKGKLDSEARKKYFQPDMHPTGEGYALIAAELLSTLEKSGLLKTLEKE